MLFILIFNTCYWGKKQMIKKKKKWEKQDIFLSNSLTVFVITNIAINKKFNTMQVWI